MQSYQFKLVCLEKIQFQMDFDAAKEMAESHLSRINVIVQLRATLKLCP